VNATEPLAWTGAFDRGGQLDALQPEPPHRHIEHVRLCRGISKMRADDAPGLRDVDNEGRAGEQFIRDLTQAVIDVEHYDAEQIDGRAETDHDWAEVLAKPAHGQRRHRMLLRLGGKLLHDGLGAQTTFALMLAWNRSMCCPPLQSFEVEKVWRWLTSKAGPR
jgi:hypothetical protein